MVDDDPDNNGKVEHLYFGDMRLDNLQDAIRDLIYDRVGGKDVPVVAVMGILQRLIIEFNNSLNGGET